MCDLAGRAVARARDGSADESAAEAAAERLLAEQELLRIDNLRGRLRQAEVSGDDRERAFRSLLVATYTAALSSSGKTDYTVDVRPLALKPADDDVTVRTLVKDSSTKPIEINYRMAKSANGWKVYDVVVENLSLVTNYRGSFNSEISRSGIDGLIKSIEAKNKQNTAG